MEGGRGEERDSGGTLGLGREEAVCGMRATRKKLQSGPVKTSGGEPESRYDIRINIRVLIQILNTSNSRT